MSYFFPVILALSLHLGLLGSFLWSPLSELDQSRPLPLRHINAQMYDLKELTTAIQKQKINANDVELVEEKQQPPKKVEPVQQPLKKAEPKKLETKPVEDLKEPLQSARELEKQKKMAQRALEKQKLLNELDKKKSAALKQREIDAQRKRLAKDQAEQQALLKQQQRKKKQQQKKIAKEKVEKQAAVDKKRKVESLAKKKEQDDKRKAQELAQVKNVQKQIAQQAEFAAEQVAIELASGVVGYINRILSSNLRIPSSARNGIKALVRVKLLQSGRVVAVQLVESSGNSAFDRAAEQAVWRSESFPRVSEIAKASPAYFNRELRTFVITFKPEELRW